MQGNTIQEDVLRKKKQLLEQILYGYGSVAVAYSSGVDSAFLLKSAHDLLGDCAIAVTVQSPLFPAREYEEAKAFCEREGIRQIVVEADPFSIDGFSRNPPNRCYLCKRMLMGAIFRAVQGEEPSAMRNPVSGLPAAEWKSVIVEGSNVDDLQDYRPGMQAVRELGIRSPLQEAGLTKAEIRFLSRQLGLETWEKPSFACLASRFVYGETISQKRLRMVERAEQLLLDLGFHQMRVRIHSDLARIEVLPEELGRATEENVRIRITTDLRKLGFRYVTLDLSGYRTGSMNEALKE